jgi:hypothetical protein
VFQGDVPIRLFLGSTLITFGSPIVAGRLEQKSDGFWKLDAVLGGRIPVNELLAAVGNFPDPTPGKTNRLCASPLYPPIKDALCGAVDINRSSPFDFKEGICDAVSSAVSLTAEQVDVGDLYEKPAEPTPCSASAVDGGLYTCQ